MRHFLKRWIVVASLLVICALVQTASFPNLSTASAAATTTYAIEVPAVAMTPAFTVSERLCMQRVVYGESRGESYAAQVAVAASMVTRSLSGQFPGDICKVALQPNQYKGYKATIILHTDADLMAWSAAESAVERATTHYDTLPDEYRQVFYFHDTSETSTWHGQHHLLGKLGKIVFYGKGSST